VRGSTRHNLERTRDRVWNERGGEGILVIWELEGSENGGRGRDRGQGDRT
jgi:hypothetical protein